MLNKPKRTPEMKLKRGLIGLMRKEPFFTSILLKMDFVAVDGFPTIAVNGKQIIYGPEWIGKQDDNKVEWLLKHEVLHVACGHHLRFGGRKHSTANVAGDLAINCIIEDHEGCPKDEGCFAGRGEFGDLQKNQTLEWYYPRVQKKEKGDQEGPMQVLLQLSQGGNGKGGNGLSPAQQDALNKIMATGVVLPVPTDAKNDIESAVRDWERMVSQAHAEAKQAGNVAGWMDELVDMIMKPAQIPWRAALRPFLAKVVHSGYTFRRPNRKYAWRNDVIMPAHYSKGLGKIVFIVDTSGSMATEECNLAIYELEGIGSEFKNVEIHMAACDTVVCWDRLFTRSDFPLNMPTHVWKGRGGTAFRPAVDWAVKQNPKAIIFLTDMAPCDPWPEDPHIPFMWLATTDVKAPWGLTIKIEPDSKRQ